MRHWTPWNTEGRNPLPQALLPALGSTPPDTSVSPSMLISFSTEIAPTDLVGLLRSDPRTRDTAVLQLSPAQGGQVDADGTIIVPCLPTELFTSVLDALAARHTELNEPEASSLVTSARTAVAA